MFSDNGASGAESNKTLCRRVRQVAAPGRSLMSTIALYPPATVTFELDLDSIKVNQCQIFRSNVVSFKRYCRYTDTHARPTGLLGPLKRLVKIINKGYKLTTLQVPFKILNM